MFELAPWSLFQICCNGNLTRSDLAIPIILTIYVCIVRNSRKHIIKSVTALSRLSNSMILSASISAPKRFYRCMREGEHILSARMDDLLFY